jgi:hypothetical protein
MILKKDLMYFYQNYGCQHEFDMILNKNNLIEIKDKSPLKVLTGKSWLKKYK